MIDSLDNIAPDEALVVVGPTGSGKSGLAMRIAEQLGGEIIGADSVQIYRYFDIDIERTNHPNLRRYYDALRERPAFQEHVMLSYEELRESDR